PRQDLDRVGLAPLRDMARGAGLSAVQLFLNILIGKRKTGRTAVDYAAVGRAVRLAERAHAVEQAEAVAGHRDILFEEPARLEHARGEGLFPGAQVPLEHEVVEQRVVQPDLLEDRRGILARAAE